MLDWKPTLNPKQRALLAEKLIDAANLALGAFVFGQLLGNRPDSAKWMLVGGVIWLGALVIGVRLIQEPQR